MLTNNILITYPIVSCIQTLKFIPKYFYRLNYNILLLYIQGEYKMYLFYTYFLHIMKLISTVT
jgi:hypothetical protein